MDTSAPTIACRGCTEDPGTTMDPLTQQLMQRAWNAERLRRQKVAIKRIVTTLRKQSSELGLLLNDDERAALDNAAHVLDR